MKTARVRAVVLVLFLAALRLSASGSSEAGGGTGSLRSIVDTGHIGAVMGLEFDDKRGLLFSAGEDGTVRVWDTSTGSLLRVLEVTQLDTEDIAVNPQAPQLAVVVTDTTGAFYLSVWDWEAQRQLYRLRLNEHPLFLRYSGMGTYLLYGESAWTGLHILRAVDGSVVDFHPEGFGIVGFAELSRTEKTLLTYLVSGRVIYWDIASGQRALDLPSVPYLSVIRISRDRRYLVGSNGREVVVVDAATGAVRGRAALPGVTSLDISASDDRVSCATSSGLAVFTFSGNSLAPAAAPPGLSLTLVRYGSGPLYFAGSTGDITALSDTGAQARLTGNRLAVLSGFAPGPGSLALASDTFVRVFQSDLLTGAVAPSFIRSTQVANPFQAPVNLAYLADGGLLAWRTDDGGPGLAVVDAPGQAGAAATGGGGAAAPAGAAAATGGGAVATGGAAVATGGAAVATSGAAAATSGAVPSASAMHVLPSVFKAPLSDLQPAGSLLLGVEAGGVLRLADIATGTSRFDVRIAGASAAVQTGPTEVLAARNASAADDGSLIRVNTRTGETVDVRDRNAYTYSLTLDPAGGVYTVGIDPTGATSLLRHDGTGLDHAVVLDSVPDEDLNVSVALDPSDGRLYATLGVDRVVAGNAGGVQPLSLGNSAPRRIRALGGLLFTLNKSGTVSVFDGVSGAMVGEIYLFSDGEWCVLLSDGHYAASPGGDIHVRVFVDGNPVKATEDFRLRL